MRFLSILMAFLCVNCYAQVCYNLEPITRCSRKVTDKNKIGDFIAQKVKGKTTGSGICFLKKGSVYIGDFNDKKFQGRGIIISSINDSISFCPGAAYFVGRFKDGKKTGKGICYNIYGEPIYIGRFAEDRPVDEFNIPVGALKYFADFKGNDFYYIGEFEGTYPHGLGAMFFQNGDFLISNFIEGERDGISICIESGGEWFSESVNGDEITPISSSYEYTALVNQSKSSFRAGLTQALGYFSQALDSGVQMTHQIHDLGSTQTYTEDDVSDVNVESDSSHNSKTSGNKYNLSEQQSYNRDKSIYSKYDGMLAAYFAGNRDATESEKRTWQTKMKQLREKWGKKGRDFPHFPNEDR